VHGKREARKPRLLAPQLLLPLALLCDVVIIRPVIEHVS
tara:strand:+ start:458 stop:574 length:117 start_codon:yes stop_codon:yes gene_type:complete